MSESRAHFLSIGFATLLLVCAVCLAPSARSAASTGRLPDEPLLSPASELRQTTVITITDGGVSPEEVVLLLGDEVAWYNASSVTQTLQSQTGHRVFVPVVLKNSDGRAGSLAQGQDRPVSAAAAPGLSGQFTITIPPARPIRTDTHRQGCTSSRLRASRDSEDVWWCNSLGARLRQPHPP